MNTISKIAAAAIALAGVGIAVGAQADGIGRHGGNCRGPAAFSDHRGGMGPSGFAHHGGGPGLRMLERFDANGDDSLTQEEIDTFLAGELAEFDTSGDQTLDLGEFESLWLNFMRERMVDHFQFLDADGDGQVTAEEFNSPFEHAVDRMDRNGDGQLDRQDRPNQDRWGNAIQQPGDRDVEQTDEGDAG